MLQVVFSIAHRCLYLVYLSRIYQSLCVGLSTYMAGMCCAVMAGGHLCYKLLPEGFTGRDGLQCNATLCLLCLGAWYMGLT